MSPTLELELPRQGLRIMDSILEGAFNSEGLPTTRIPAGSLSLLTDLNDIAPFFIAGGKTRELVTRLKPYFSRPHPPVPTFNGRLVSWRLDEYVGGLAALYDADGAAWLWEEAQRALAEIRRAADQEDVLCMYYDYARGRRSPIRSPWSMGLAEVFLSQPKLECADWAKRMLGCWAANAVFWKNGVFPTRWHGTSRVWNAVWERGRFDPEARLSLLSNTQFYYMPGWRRAIGSILAAAPIGSHFQNMKPNTNIIFAFLEWFVTDQNETARAVLSHFVSKLSRTFVKDGLVHMYWRPGKGPQSPHLDAQFATIDILCDYFHFVDKKSEWLDLACRLGDAWWALRWPSGFVPTAPDKDVAHIDGQNDFSVSLWRLYELTGDEKYRERSRSLFEAVLEKAKPSDERGLFYQHLHKDGHPVPETFYSSKYNGLLLKGMIRQANPGLSSFTDAHFREIMKDR